MLLKPLKAMLFYISTRYKLPCERKFFTVSNIEDMEMSCQDEDLE